jgi:hypothetical protein
MTQIGFEPRERRIAERTCNSDKPLQTLPQPLITPLRHCCRYSCDQEIVTCRVVIQQIYSFFRFGLSVKENNLVV